MRRITFPLVAVFRLLRITCDTIAGHQFSDPMKGSLIFYCDCIHALHHVKMMPEIMILFKELNNELLTAVYFATVVETPQAGNLLLKGYILNPTPICNDR